MKSNTLVALAVAGTLACGGVVAGGLKHGSSVEVAGPASVSESAPWLANQAHSAGWSRGMHDDAVGASAGVAGSGSGGFDSRSTSGLGASSSRLESSVSGPYMVEYWLWTDDAPATGASSGRGASGSGGFDSMSSLSERSPDT